MSEHEAVKPRLERAFVRALGLPHDTDCQALRYRHDARWDSVAQFQLVLEIEREFGVSLSDDDVLDMTSFERVLEILERDRTGGGASSMDGR